ncbi:MAG: PolC-type DNA polymerase III, partial [Clostridiales bacterium]|nr:PolC-type DNA polymerase III [Clostridiales bacterium]
MERVITTRTGAKGEVTSVSYSKGMGVLTITLKLLCPPTAKHVGSLMSKIYGDLGAEDGVCICFDASAFTQNDAKDLFCALVTLQNGGLLMGLSGTRLAVSEHTILLDTQGDNPFLQSQVTLSLLRDLAKRMGYELMLTQSTDGFEFTPITAEDYALTGEEKADLAEEQKQNKPEPKKESKKPLKAEKKEDKTQKEKVILGKVFKPKQIYAIDELTLETGNATIVGKVIGGEIKQFGSGRMLLLANVSDNKGTIVVKAFLDGKMEQKCSRLLTGEGKVTVRGNIDYDARSKEICLMARDILLSDDPGRLDTAPIKRVELHAHTKMSSQDGLADAGDLIRCAAKFGHSAIAVTDHAVVQAFPDAYGALGGANKKYGSDLKLIYGLEAYLVNDTCYMGPDAPLNELVVFDVETTGLDKKMDTLIEIGACVIKDGKITEEFNTFVDPGRPIPRSSVEITGITDEMVKGAPNTRDALVMLNDFIKNRPLCAHNASFDIAFLRNLGAEYGLTFDYGVLDTLALARMLLPNQGRYNLGALCKFFNVRLSQAHRAVHDAIATAEVMHKLIELGKEEGAESLCGLNGLGATKGLPYYHIILLAQNKEGLMNLYKVVSESHLKGFYRRPLIKKSFIESHREGMLIGSACEQGEVFRAILERYDDAHVKEIASFYDYLEVQPLGNNRFLLGNKRESTWVETEEDLKAINCAIIDLAKELDKPYVATSDSHFIEPEDEYFRRILMDSQGFDDADRQPPLFFHTTDEMLDEFYYLDEETRMNAVVHNTVKIAESIEYGYGPFPDEEMFPVEEGAAELMVDVTMAGAKRVYGEELPEPVLKRLERELGSITKYGYATLYTSAYKLVKHSNDLGYTVGSRGSVGSSFVAFCMGISEVNPLSPHYRCPSCKYSDFDTAEYGIDCGVDLPHKDCPVCGKPLVRDGFEIPFEVFLGFEGDKVPDIDLNFSGENQNDAFLKVEEMFGSENVFRAGTIIAIAEKTAYGIVMKYMERHGIQASRAEVDRLSKGITGVKKTTGCHPGGMVIVPKTINVHLFTPVQHPADKTEENTVTTHFAFSSLHDRLLKLDILGHDNPTIIKRLYEFTGVDPITVPINDEAVLSMFRTNEVLGVDPERYGSKTGAIGIPEFGTPFVRGMLEETLPTTVGELIRISGLSHGTDVWLGNAQEIIRNGDAPLSKCICCRDDIMIALISYGVEPLLSFKTMESVRKGRGLTEQMETAMRQNGVPDWFIDS